MNAHPKHWVITFAGKVSPVKHGDRATAIHYADRHFRSAAMSPVSVEHETTHEKWVRRAGSWFRAEDVERLPRHPYRGVE